MYDITVAHKENGQEKVVTLDIENLKEIDQYFSGTAWLVSSSHESPLKVPEYLALHAFSIVLQAIAFVFYFLPIVLIVILYYFHNYETKPIDRLGLLGICTIQGFIAHIFSNCLKAFRDIARNSFLN